jgi:hypothetical protein
VPVLLIMFLIAAACAYYAQRCFAGARGATGAGRLRWQARGLLLTAGAFGPMALALVPRAPAFAIGAGGLAVTALVASLVVGARASREPPP